MNWAAVHQVGADKAPNTFKFLFLASAGGMGRWRWLSVFILILTSFCHSFLPLSVCFFEFVSLSLSSVCITISLCLCNSVFIFCWLWIWQSSFSGCLVSPSPLSVSPFNSLYKTIKDFIIPFLFLPLCLFYSCSSSLSLHFSTFLLLLSFLFFLYFFSLLSKSWESYVRPREERQRWPLPSNSFSSLIALFPPLRIYRTFEDIY